LNIEIKKRLGNMVYFCKRDVSSWDRPKGFEETKVQMMSQRNLAADKEHYKPLTWRMRNE
jgi:hypothetical protein